MGTLKIKLCNEQVKRSAIMEVNAEAIRPETAQTILEGMYAFLSGTEARTVTVHTNVNGPDPAAVSTAVTSALQRSMESLKAKQNAEVAAAKVKLTDVKELGSVEPKPLLPEGALPNERPRRLPYVDERPRFGVTLGTMFPGLADLIQEAADAEGEGKNVPGRSGIKFDEDGRPLLRAKYFCKDLNCQHKGLRFVPDGSTYCRCHNCGTKLALRQAHPEQPMNESGAFFIADKLYFERGRVST